MRYNGKALSHREVVKFYNELEWQGTAVIKHKPEETLDEGQIGWLGTAIRKGKPFFKCSEQYLTSLIESERFLVSATLHAWLTLPSLEIIDFTGGYSVERKIISR